MQRHSELTPSLFVVANTSGSAGFIIPQDRTRVYVGETEACLFLITAHELGHILELDDLDENKDLLMHRQIVTNQGCLLNQESWQRVSLANTP